jgi:hypothetical protein
MHITTTTTSSSSSSPRSLYKGSASSSCLSRNFPIFPLNFGPRFRTTLNTFPAVESIGGLYEHDPSSNLHPWSSGIAPFDARSPLWYQAEFLQPFPRLRVLYIIVKPEDIIKQVVNPQQSSMTNYHRDYTQTVHQFPPKAFNARQRIYYEMPEMTCNGLQWLYQTIKHTSAEARRKSNPELPPLVIRVMTWRHAPGVRGRFDPN